MINERQFLNLLERAEAGLRPAAAVALTETMASVAVEAKAYIGHEMPLWPPLAESTIRDKEQAGFPTPAPLLRTGEMRASIEFEVDAGTLTGAVGSHDMVALYQEIGTSKIPPRPFLKTAMLASQPQAEIFFGRALETLLTPSLTESEGRGVCR
jgi:HK97 gp10 family phage protein